MSVARAEREAQELLHLWRILQPEDIDVEEIACLCGAMVRDCQLTGAEARLVRLGPKAVISVSDAVNNVGRRRFGIAHEVGHLRLHDGDLIQICTSEDVAAFGHEEKGQKPKELEANAFAAELLLPRAMVVPRLRGAKPSLDIIEDLAKQFSTSLSATARRFVSLTKESCALVFSKDGRIKSFSSSDDFGFWIPVGEPLDRNSLAYDYFQGRALPTYSETVDASAWLRGRLVQDAVIKEHSRALGRYGLVMSLLWINETVEEDEDDWDDSETFTPDGRYKRRD